MLRFPTRSALEATGLITGRSEEHTSELQSRLHLVCRLLLEKKNKQHVTARRQNSHLFVPASTNPLLDRDADCTSPMPHAPADCAGAGSLDASSLSSPRDLDH